jgi:hypothetical protein
MDTAILSSLGPVLVLLALAVIAAIGSQVARTSPIVGYLLLGVALNAGISGSSPALTPSARSRIWA